MNRTFLAAAAAMFLSCALAPDAAEEDFLPSIVASEEEDTALDPTYELPPAFTGDPQLAPQQNAPTGQDSLPAPLQTPTTPTTPGTQEPVVSGQEPASTLGTDQDPSQRQDALDLADASVEDTGSFDASVDPSDIARDPDLTSSEPAPDPAPAPAPTCDPAACPNRCLLLRPCCNAQNECGCQGPLTRQCTLPQI